MCSSCLLKRRRGVPRLKKNTVTIVKTFPILSDSTQETAAELSLWMNLPKITSH